MLWSHEKLATGAGRALGSRKQLAWAFAVLFGMNLVTLFFILTLWSEVRRISVIGIRGATTAENNTAAAILSSTEELVLEILSTNGLRPSDVADAIFTVTPDLTAAFAATAARTRVGIVGVPLFGAVEAVVDGAPPRCIRVLLHARSAVRQVAPALNLHSPARAPSLLRPAASILSPLPDSFLAIFSCSPIRAQLPPPPARAPSRGQARPPHVYRACPDPGHSIRVASSETLDPGRLNRAARSESLHPSHSIRAPQAEAKNIYLRGAAALPSSVCPFNGMI